MSRLFAKKITIGIILLIVSVALFSCKATRTIEVVREVPVEVEKIVVDKQTDSVYVDRWHTELMKGDTIFVHDSIVRWRERVKETHDTIEKPITIIDTETVIKEVKKPTPWLVKALAWVVAFSILGIALWVAIRMKMPKS